MRSSLTIRAGAGALRLLGREGLSSDRVTAIAGAAGGPKWLALSQIDRVLFGEWIKPRSHPLFLIGSSIGTWRFSAVARSQPSEGIEAFERAYLGQEYSSPNPTPAEVTKESLRVMNGFLSEQNISEVLNHPYYRLNVITILCKNILASDRKAALLTGLGAAALANTIHPNLLKPFFERTIFSDPRSTPGFIEAPGFSSYRFDLTPLNFRKAIMASGSIPGVMQGVSDLPGQEGRIFRDGGMRDYHMDLPYHGGKPTSDLVLLPHFSEKIIPGWFDKALPWRKPSPKNLDNVILIAPSREFIASLPLGKIPDRKDFKLFEGRDAARVDYWKKVIAECQRLGDELRLLLQTGRVSEVARPLFPS